MGEEELSFTIGQYTKTRISPHREYASAVRMELIFLAVKQCDTIFEVRIIRACSVTKSGRV